MKKLLSCIAALFTIFSIVSCLQEERSPEEILVPSPAEVNCSESFSITSKVPKGSEKLVEECGFLVGTTKDLADALTVEGAMTENTFSAALPARKYGTTYYICSYVTNGRGSEIRSELISYELKSLEEYVSFGKIKLLSYNPLTKQAEITIPVEIQSGVNVTEVGVCYGSSESLSDEDTYVEGTISEDGTITVSLEGFKDGTQYYMRPYIKENEYIAYAETSPFFIQPIPVVVTYAAEDITSESAVLSGEVERGESITERGFVWLNGQGTPTIDSYKLKVDGTLGKFTASLSDLDANERYAYRAYAVNDQGVFYGDILTFTTIAGAASLSATKVTNITTTSATFTCTVASHGGETVSEVGFYYSKEESVDIETARKVSEPFSSDNFTLSVSDLEVGTTYYVMAFARNSAGEAYNTITSFKTVSTSPTVATKGYSKIAATSTELSGEVADDNGETITERGFVWMTGTGTPSTSSGNRIQVIGTTGEFSATLEDLEPNQTYSYRAYAVNSKGTSYGETLTFKTDVALPVVEFTGCSDVTSLSAVVSGKITDHGGETVSETGFLYGTTPVLDPSAASRVKSAYSGDSFNFTLSGLTRAQNYYVQPFATNSKGTSYGDVTMFTTLPSLPIVTTNDVTAITDNSAMSGGVVADDGGGEILAKGVVWSKLKNPTIESMSKTDEGTGLDSFTSTMSNLTSGSTYYVRAYATNVAGTGYGEEMEFKTTGEAPYIALEAANCFIVSSSETYSFKTVKGNSSESVGDVASAEVLWESFGTSETPSVGSLIASVAAESGSIVFEVADPYREGNAVIAAKDASGTILWSWHIWLTDQPEEHIYPNNAGTMMDRNLGATSATPGEVGALGLLYQWGRKDPFLSSSSIHDEYTSTEAKSTIVWPSTVASNSSNGTIEYSVEHPTTFITNSSNYDWYYTGSSSTDDTRWQSEKTIYDPCPSGWRVPDGGDNGVWNVAGFSGTTYDDTNKGISFSISSPSTTWYPASGFRSSNDGVQYYVGHEGDYWSVTPYSNYAFNLLFNKNGKVYPTYKFSRAYGFSVRCVQESE